MIIDGIEECIDPKQEQAEKVKMAGQIQTEGNQKPTTAQAIYASARGRFAVQAGSISQRSQSIIIQNANELFGQDGRIGDNCFHQITPNPDQEPKGDYERSHDWGQAIQGSGQEDGIGGREDNGELVIAQ